jgi:hypothetical protein
LLTFCASDLQDVDAHVFAEQLVRLLSTVLARINPKTPHTLVIQLQSTGTEWDISSWLTHKIHYIYDAATSKTVESDLYLRI